jgi:hypothetical protein
MYVTVSFRQSDGQFTWKRVLPNELNSVFAEISDLAEKDSRAKKAARQFKRQAKLNSKANRGEIQCPKKRPRK